MTPLGWIQSSGLIQSHSGFQLELGSLFPFPFPLVVNALNHSSEGGEHVLLPMCLLPLL